MDGPYAVYAVIIKIDACCTSIDFFFLTEYSP